MPLPKRQVEPIHVARNTLPGDMPVPSELEAVTNGTLANTVRQLSSLSRHAEDLFGELQREAATLAARATSVQSRIDRLAVKVTQLDSGGEEVSLQDMHLRKAFKSSVVFDQQVVSRETMPSAMLEQYMQCDKPPPLQKLNPYREDGKDGLKFYTDPNYFFDLWRQEMLKDTERMMHDRGKKPHRPRGAEGGRQHKKRVRQPHNTRERQRQVAMGQGEYLMPEANNYRSSKAGSFEEDMVDQRPPRPSSIELRSNYSENDQVGGMHMQHHNMVHPDNDPYGRSQYQAGYNMHTAMYIQQQQQQQQQHVIYARGMNMQDPYGHTIDHRQSSRSNSIPQNGPGTPGQRPSQPPPAPPSTNNSESNTPTTLSASGTPTRGRSMSATRDTLPPPPPPPNDMVTSPQSNGSIPSHLRSQMRSSMSPPRTASPHHHMDHDLPPPPPAPEEHNVPPSPPPAPSPPSAAVPPPPPPPPPAGASESGPHHIMANGDVNKVILKSPPTKAPPAPKPVDPRSDLLKAIRDGITLRKVEKSEQKDVEKSNALHDVASILARRVAVEFSDSESGSDSEESDGWEEDGGGTAANAT